MDSRCISYFSFHVRISRARNIVCITRVKYLKMMLRGTSKESLDKTSDEDESEYRTGRPTFVKA